MTLARVETFNQRRSSRKIMGVVHPPTYWQGKATYWQGRQDNLERSGQRVFGVYRVALENYSWFTLLGPETSCNILRYDAPWTLRPLAICAPAILPRWLCLQGPVLATEHIPRCSDFLVPVHSFVYIQ